MTTHSGDTSPGGSNSLSDSSVRTRTSEESQAIPHKAFHLDCYNSSPDQDDESDGQCDDETLSQLMLHSDLLRQRISVGVQTDHNEDFPPLKFLQALGEDHAVGFINQQQLYYSSGGGSEVPHPQNPSQLPIPNLSATTPITTATAINTIDASSSSSDGTLQLVIQNFRHMSDTVRGPCKYIQSVPWRIMVMPRQHVVQKKGTQKCLGFFLQCCPDAYSESWSCQASAELRLISQKNGIPNFIRKTNHVYTAKENDWGYSCFMTWADILDESQGYIKDDKVTLEVQVKADTPKNILTHSEFKKKIQDYKRLADLQCQRGLIDKAIECNTQALKFCKDKDPQCKAELEAQKAHLIEMKLKQSIQRIEKGNDGSKLEDDSTTNLNALRQALGTTTRCNTAKATKNKSTSTKDSNTAPLNNHNISAAEKQQQQQRAGTPPYTTQKIGQNDGRGDQKTAKQTQKTSKSVEPQGQKISSKTKFTGKEDEKPSKKRLYKSASSNEIFCAAGSKCKGYLNNNKALVALGHFNKALLNSDDFDYMKDRYQEEEELLPDQIQHFLKHLSEGDKTALRLKEQMEKLELLASPFDKPDPFLEGLMKLSPEEADAFVKAITYCAYEQDDEEPEANQLEKRLSHVIRNKFCESCLKEGHFQIEKRETSESGCQTEFNPARRIPREALPTDDTTLRMMQQLQHQQMIGQQANEEYINALKSQAYAAVQQHQNQPVPALPARRKKATAKKNLQQSPQMPPNFHQQNLLQQQQQFQQQFIQANATRGENSQQKGIEALGALDLNNPHMDMFAAANKSLIGGAAGLDMNLNTLTNFELSKIHFPTDPTISDPNQQNIFSRQCIEEWLRYSTRNLLKTNYEMSEKQQQMAGGSAGGSEGAANSAYPFDSQDLTATQAALVQLHCLNAKTIQNKMEEFIQTLETHANFRDLRNSIDRLLTLCSDDENFTSAEDSVSVISVSECSGRDLDLAKDPMQSYTALQRSFIEDDPHDYMLLREMKQQEIVLATRLNSILYQLHQASIADIVDKIESKVKVMDEKLKLSRTETMALKTNDKKAGEQLAIIQKEFQNLNGKYEKLIQQLKDRKNEIKKLEKKAKSEAQLMTENQELVEKMDAMKKELSQVQRQLADEQAKYKRDTQSLADSKKHLNVELNAKYTEVQKLTSQFEEKGQAVKKLESQLANERKNNSQTVANLTERVKRAEVNLLEHKLEDGLRVLERAKEDCNTQIKVLEAEKQKRTSASELEVVKKNIGEWESKREEVVTLIGQAKTDFQAHIQAVKSGKQLSQLPKIQVPKPPPCPKIHPMPQPVQATSGPQVVPQSPLPLERKVITPPNRTRAGAITPQQNQPQTTSQMPASPGCPPPFQPIGMTPATPQQISQSANVTPVKGGSAQFHSQAMTSQPPPLGHMPPPSIAPIGSRPTNYQNGISVPPPTTPQHKFQAHQQGQRQSPQLVPLMGHQNQFQPAAAPPMHQQFNVAPPSTAGQPPHTQQQAAQSAQPQQIQPQNAAGGSYQTWNGGWGATGGDHLNMNNIGDIFGQGRSFGPLGSDFGGGNQAIGAFRSASVTHQPPAGVIGPPGSSANPSSQPIGAGRNVQNVSPSLSQQQQQQRNGWSSFSADTWNPALSGRQN